jgi:hypothetical protein
VEASAYAKTLFTGFAEPSGGVGGGWLLVPRHRKGIQRERRHGREVVTALPDDGERESAGDGWAPVAPSGEQTRLAAGADRGKAGPDIAGDYG